MSDGDRIRPCVDGGSTPRWTTPNRPPAAPPPPAAPEPPYGDARLYRREVLQADQGCDSASPRARPSPSNGS